MFVVFTDLSNIPNPSSANEEPENLEVKPLTPREPYLTELENQQDSQRRSSPESGHPSTFAFPSEDEPVTLISKSIPPSAMRVAFSRGRQSAGEGIFSELQHNLKQVYYSFDMLLRSRQILIVVISLHG